MTVVWATTGYHQISEKAFSGGSKYPGLPFKAMGTTRSRLPKAMSGPVVLKQLRSVLLSLASATTKGM